MDKFPAPTSAVAHRAPRGARRWSAFGLLAFSAASWLLWQLSDPPPRLEFDRGARHSRSTDWADIKALRTLQFEPCFGDYECARLDVPLDWSAPPEQQEKKRAAIAITRLPAKVPLSDPRYGGAILINPGGPGGSGVSAVMSYGSRVQVQADAASHPCMSAKDSGDKYFDVIGFDPRGINNTEPHGSCFPDDASRDIWEVQKEAQGIVTNQTYPYVWARSQGMSKSCASRLDSDDFDHVGRHSNTPVVVEDMIAIAEALGQWREARVRAQCGRFDSRERNAALERSKWQKGQEKILYWGFSYGTILGASFASMHPDRLHRFVVDGVADAEDYYKGLWATNLQDTDKIIANFATQCRAAGPEKCAIAALDEEPEEVLNSVLDGLQQSPLTVSASGKYGPDLITYSDAMLYIRKSLYRPEGNFPFLARLVASIYARNGSEAAAVKQDAQQGLGCRSETCSRNPWSNACHDPSKGVPEQGLGVLCSDVGPWLSKTDAAFHQQKFEMLLDQSKYLAGYWAEITMGCASWNIRPSWEFTPSLEGDTSHPILWLANTRDPVTPLRNAVKMSKRFPGSKVLTLDADGHCTLSAPSLCVARKVRKYFQTGELPDEEEICRPEIGPFDEPKPAWIETQVAGSAASEEERLLQAVQQMQEISVQRHNGPLGI